MEPAGDHRRTDFLGKGQMPRVCGQECPSQGVWVEGRGAEAAAPLLSALSIPLPPFLSSLSFLELLQAGGGLDTVPETQELRPCWDWEGNRRGQGAGMAGAGGLLAYPRPPVSPLGSAAQVTRGIALIVSGSWALRPTFG